MINCHHFTVRIIWPKILLLLVTNLRLRRQQLGSRKYLATKKNWAHFYRDQVPTPVTRSIPQKSTSWHESQQISVHFILLQMRWLDYCGGIGQFIQILFCDYVTQNPPGYSGLDILLKWNICSCSIKIPKLTSILKLSKNGCVVKKNLQNILLLAITSIKFIVLNWMKPN